MAIKIDKNIPLPENYKVPKRPGKYDILPEMVDYDSVFFPDTSRTSVRQAISTFIKSLPEEKRSEYDFHDDVTTENGQTGIRIWLNPFKPKEGEKKNTPASNE